MRISSSFSATAASFLVCSCSSIPGVHAQEKGHRLWSLMGGLFENDDDGDGILSSTLRQFRQWSDPESTSAGANANNETTVVPNQFIVRFNDGGDDDELLLDDDVLQERAALVAKITGGTILHIYRYTFQGVAIVVNNTKQRATTTGPLWTPSRSNGLRAQKLGILEEDRRFRLDVVRAAHNSSNRQTRRRNMREFMTATNNAIPVGLDRIDQVMANPLDGRYVQAYNGTGVTVFVLDSGLRTSHVEFMPSPPPPPAVGNGTNTTTQPSPSTLPDSYSSSSSSSSRATCGYDFFERDETSLYRCLDLYEHGTHVAGTIGGRRAGVAKNVKIIGVKVLGNDGSGTDAAVLAGIDYVLGQRKNDQKSPMVVNMSFGRVYSLRYNWAVRKLHRAGIVVIAAAGNAARNACLASPASSRFAVTVGSSEYSRIDNSDVRSAFSNHGRCVDIAAPGSEITSAGSGRDNAYSTYSGTSMSAPHVAGAAALYLEQNPSWTPHQVRDALLSDALTGQLLPRSNKRSPNRLLYTGNI